MRRPPTDGPSSGHRLRNLDRPGRIIAAAVALLLLAPFAWSAGRSLADGWTPTGDEALLALRSHDVLGGHPPLVGQPSTSYLYGGRPTNHPGPIQLWLFAGPVRLLGPAIGMKLGAAALNGAAVVLAAWVALRRAGPAVALGASLMLALVVWAQGTDVASDPLSSNQGAYPFLALAFLTWALLAGDVRLAPPAAVVASFTAQQHLNQVIPVLLLVIAAGFGLCWPVVRRRRELRRRSPADRPRPPPQRGLRWLVLAAALGVVSALPVLVQEVTGRPGNIGAVIRYSGEASRPTLGAVRGATQVLRAVGSPVLLVRPNLTGFQAQGPLFWPAAVAGIVVLAGLGWMAARDRRRERAPLAVVALVVAAAGFVNGTNLLRAEGTRINQYRWMWTLCALAWLAIAWWVGERIAPVVRRMLGGAASRAVPAAVGCVVVVLLIGDVGAFAVRSRDDRARFDTAFDLVRTLQPPTRAATRGSGTWLVAIDGLLASNTVAPALVLDLVDHGVNVEVAEIGPTAAWFYGSHRRYREGTVRGVLLVRSTLGPARGGPGRRVAVGRLNPGLNRLIDRVAPSLRGRPVVPAPNGREEAALRGLGLDGLERYVTLLRAGRVGRDPHALRDGPLIRGLNRGMLRSPRLPERTLSRLVHLLDAGGDPLLWDQDTVEVRLITPGQLAALGRFR